MAFPDSSAAALKNQMATKKSSISMQWPRDHDVLLCREVLASGMYKQKKGSNEAGRLWNEIALTLKKSPAIQFKNNLSQRAVRGRFALLQARFKENGKEEIAASGISPAEQDELDMLLEDITERERDAIHELSSKKDQDKAVGEDIRMQAMERMGQAKKRKAEEKKELMTEKRKRRSSNEAFQFLQEKAATDMAFRKEELEFRKQEEQSKSGQFATMIQQQQALLQTMTEQQAQQQQQSQNLHMIMAQQNQAILTVLEKIVSK